jgi:putative addiction module killer protein
MARWMTTVMPPLPPRSALDNRSPEATLKDMPVKVTEVYRDWINSLKDLAGRARVQVRVDRLVHGNPGKHRVLTGGVCELKIDFGPGYRVYYTERGGTLIVLLAGGDKSTQDQDIKTAMALAKNL